jgi:hypothetical protein
LTPGVAHRGRGNTTNHTGTAPSWLFRDHAGFDTFFDTKPFVDHGKRRDLNPRAGVRMLLSAEDRWMLSLATAEGSGPGSQDPGAGHPAQVN